MNKDPRLEAFLRLLNIMDDLREKCPWDKKQTMHSLRHLSLEEIYELSDAILNEDMEDIKKELGDIMLHVVFYARIASESKDFTITEVLNQICDKLIHRHPHIYGDVNVDSEEEVKANWEKIKLKEGKNSVLEGVPVGLPALVKASRIQDKVKGVGFEWERTEDVHAKVLEEMGELEEARRTSHHREIEEEMGDLFFAIVNYSRFLGVNAEDALEKANRKFIGRFQDMEKLAESKGTKLQELKLDQMEELWQEVK